MLTFHSRCRKERTYLVASGIRAAYWLLPQANCFVSIAKTMETAGWSRSAGNIAKSSPIFIRTANSTAFWEVFSGRQKSFSFAAWKVPDRSLVVLPTKLAPSANSPDVEATRGLSDFVIRGAECMQITRGHLIRPRGDAYRSGNRNYQKKTLHVELDFNRISSGRVISHGPAPGGELRSGLAVPVPAGVLKGTLPAGSLAAANHAPTQASAKK
jgi:hypothetical protein